MTTATLTRPAADKKTTKTAAPVKSVLNESRQIERAAMLIQMGARMQVLESETTLSYERLIRLYKEIAGKSPSKGQLPFSTDWFLTWQENIHSSLFLNIYEYLAKGMDLDPVDQLTKAYRLYTEQIATAQVDDIDALRLELPGLVRHREGRGGRQVRDPLSKET